jgi:SAM-dependent methyltransferase
MMTTDGRTAPRPAPAGPVQPRLLFINGFHRSGTTVMTSAVTEALGGVTTTVGVLARHIPTLDALLETVSAGTVDRGADRLQITPQTTEEYGFLLHHHTGKHALYGHPDGLRLLREHIAELAAEGAHGTIVLKNPWEVGHEARMLADHPDARIIILRRRLADIERSVDKALLRASSSAYSRALDGDSEDYHRLQGLLASRWKRPLLLRVLRLVLRRRAYRLASSVRKLPADRVAFLSYDELRANPKAGAAWAAHLLDPQALAEAFTKHAFAERGAQAPSSMAQRALDRRWKRAWENVRAAQVRAGIVAPPTGVLLRRASALGQLRALLITALRFAPSVKPWLQKSVWKVVYGMASRGIADPGTAFMNYGYAPLEESHGVGSTGDGKPDIYGIQLYDRAASGSDLTGKDVLEVGCGRGGGTAFVYDRDRPRSMTGLDLAHSAIARCRRQHVRPGLTFVRGDAEALPFADASFDVVLNVESSHCYPDVPRFLVEVHRVLRPDGFLLLADVRPTKLGPRSGDTLMPRSDVSQFLSELRDSPLTVIEQEDITANVLRALQLDGPRRRRLIENRVPGPLQAHALAFAAVEGTPLYESYATGGLTYLRLVLQKA